MSHSARCISANRFGDGFDCICEPDPRGVDQATFDQQRRWTQEAEAALKAAQARIAQLEAQAQRDFDLAADWKAALEAERVEHQALKDRVERAVATMTLAFGGYVADWPQGARDALEALRGR